MIIDNCSAHAPIETLQSDDGNIVAYLLPPNVTAAIQPMDQNPIKLTKLLYRNKLLSHLVAQDNVDIDDYLKKHQISDAIVLLKQAWDELPQNVIEKSWHKIMNWDASQFDEEDDLPLSDLRQSNAEYIAAAQQTQILLSKIAPNDNINAEEIEAWNDDVYEEDSNDMELESDDEDAEYDATMNAREPMPKISYSTAIDGVNNLIKWCEESPLYSAKHMSNLLSVRSDIVQANLNKTRKQSSITDYMKKTD